MSSHFGEAKSLDHSLLVACGGSIPGVKDASVAADTVDGAAAGMVGVPLAISTRLIDP